MGGDAEEIQVLLGSKRLPAVLWRAPMSCRRALHILSLIVAASCAGDPGPQTLPSETQALSAAGYCEAIVDFFCDFYLRCGRMAVGSIQQCHEVFLETCNDRYEERYVRLEEAGLLSLSAEGTAACHEHLDSVTCAAQIRDLHGPCATMWVGGQDVGDACGIDIESFVCGADATCVLDFSFCGTCEPLIPTGESCGDADGACGPSDACREDVCVRRREVGEPCSNLAPCVLGVQCVGGVCDGPSFVGEGAGCSGSRRCPYMTRCIAGICQPAIS